MSFPLIILLYIYYAFVAVWALFSLVAVYHVVRFSQVNLVSLFSLVAYAGGSMAILVVSLSFISQIDWSRTIDILGGAISITL